MQRWHASNHFSLAHANARQPTLSALTAAVGSHVRTSASITPLAYAKRPCAHTHARPCVAMAMRCALAVPDVMTVRARLRVWVCARFASHAHAIATATAPCLPAQANANAGTE